MIKVEPYQGNDAMAMSKLGQRRQVVIPKEICEELGLQVGDYLEVQTEDGRVVIKPKRLVDADLVLTPDEEAMVRKGREELRKGEYVSLEELEHALDDQTRQRGHKTAQRSAR